MLAEARCVCVWGVGGFRFKSFWLEEEDCRKVIEEAWKSAAAIPHTKVSGGVREVAAGLSS